MLSLMCCQPRESTEVNLQMLCPGVIKEDLLFVFYYLPHRLPGDSVHLIPLGN